jgi:hypothetical protein
MLAIMHITFFYNHDYKRTQPVMRFLVHIIYLVLKHIVMHCLFWVNSLMTTKLMTDKQALHISTTFNLDTVYYITMNSYYSKIPNYDLKRK